MNSTHDTTCHRCGAGEQATHHPLCQHRDGTPTSLSDQEVRQAICVLQQGYIPEPTRDVGDEASEVMGYPQGCDAAPPEEVASDPEAVAYHQKQNQRQQILRNVMYLAVLDGWPSEAGPISQLVDTAMKDHASDAAVAIALAVTDILAERRDKDAVVPF